MRTVNVLLSLLVSAILALSVFEGGLRLIGLGPPDTGLQHDPQLGWSKTADHELHRRTGEYDVTIRTNAWGLRGETLEQKANPAGNFRVLALGDSFTLGFTVSEDDLFGEQLERWWRSENRRVDLINAGTQGYSTDQAVLWAERNAADFEPNLVLLFPYENDIYWNGQGTYQTSPKPLYNVDGTLETGVLEKPPGRGFLHDTAIGRLFEKKQGGPTFVPDGSQKPILREFAPLLTSPPDFLEDAEARTKGALIGLERTCRELGAKLVVVPIPSHSAVDPSFASARFGPEVLGLPDSAWDPNRPVEFFLGVCNELGITTLDVRKALRDRTADGEQLYYKRDWHLNPKGNAVLAGALHAGLGRLGVFPAENSATRVASLPPVPVEPTGFPGWAKLYLGLWVLLSVIYARTYPKDAAWKGPLGVAGMLGLVFSIVIGGTALLDILPPRVAQAVGIVFVIGLLGFVGYKLGRRIGTIAELMKAFTLRGHWYLMPLVVVLLTIGSLLVVAASSPLIAPFIYTLF